MSGLIAQAPALPLDEAGKYVAAAYGVFVVMILVYVGIMAVRLRTLEKDALELLELIEKREESGEAAPDLKKKVEEVAL